MIKIAILGFGTVGSGVYEVIKKNGESIKRKIGKEVLVKRILDIRDFPDHEEKHLFTKEYNDILNDDEIKIVVEVMGGVSPAYSYTKAALLNNKHVVTSNKELVATHGAELLKIAKDNNINYLFEASVGGGIPIIRPLNQCLAANEISSIMGILNGTTNYILTKMIKEGKTFDDALKKAQEKGYAERNPDADILGYDTCRKIAILSSLVYGKQVDYNLIYTEGITKITKEDILFADSLDCVIKLIGFSELKDDKVFARVSPMIIPSSNPLATVEGVFNAILVKGDSIGDCMFYGKGAGKYPTASAVVADIIDITKNIDKNNRLYWGDGVKDFVIDIKESVSSFMIRVKENEIENVRKIFNDVEFIYARGVKDEVAFIVPSINEGELAEKVSKIDGFISKMRMAE